MTAELPTLYDWPVARPRRWTDPVNEPQNPSEQAAVEHCMKRGCPFGSESWAAKMVDKLKLAHTQREPGRPKKKRAARKR